jgi:hypothetical protein
MAPVKSWEGMRERCTELLLRATGEGVDAWNERVRGSDIADQAALRSWLAGQGITGYAQALLVWERFGYPDFMTAEAGDLIDGQYADRPALRPILEAVLAVLPDIGDVTVQARKTIISLVSPKRTFAVVQATTRSRVDLGLRLDGQQPEGRLLAARDIGMANLRLALTEPGDLDAEALALLRRAYQESVAPPKPRAKPATPRSRPEKIPVRVVIEGIDLPGLACNPASPASPASPAPDGTGYHNVHVALYGTGREEQGLTVAGKPFRVTEPFPGDAASVRWEVAINVLRGEDGFDFGGPCVRGDKTDRHLGLAWGELTGDRLFQLFRGAKLRLADVDPALIEQATRPGHTLVARIRLTDDKGNPICARVPSSHLTWEVRGD